MQGVCHIQIILRCSKVPFLIWFSWLKQHFNTAMVAFHFQLPGLHFFCLFVSASYTEFCILFICLLGPIHALLKFLSWSSWFIASDKRFPRSHMFWNNPFNKKNNNPRRLRTAPCSGGRGWTKPPRLCAVWLRVKRMRRGGVCGRDKYRPKGEGDKDGSLSEGLRSNRNHMSDSGLLLWRDLHSALH